jgi:hypothetical protein
VPRAHDFLTNGAAAADCAVCQEAFERPETVAGGCRGASTASTPNAWTRGWGKAGAARSAVPTWWREQKRRLF